MKVISNFKAQCDEVRQMKNNNGRLVHKGEKSNYQCIAFVMKNFIVMVHVKLCDFIRLVYLNS